MDTPICFTQLFVDKQNVRSSGNIFKVILLKEENHIQFLENVFEEPALVSQLSTDIEKVLFVLKTNIKNSSKDDFRSYFTKPNDLNLVSLNKSDVMNKCWTALISIIPKTFFGVKRNESLFKEIIETVIYGMKSQHIQLGKYMRKWDFSFTPWKSLSTSESDRILFNIVCWIIRNLLSLIICLNYHVTTCKLDHDENKLHFFWKHQWQSFFDKSIRKMVLKGIIKKVEPYSMGRKLVKNHDLDMRLKLKNIKKETPKLHLILKLNNDFRPIIRYKYDAQTSLEKQVIKRKLNFLRLLAGIYYPKMEVLYNSLYLKWLQLGKPKLYFIKTDLSNAFGSVDKTILLKIMQENFLKYQNKEENFQAKEKNIRLFKEIFNEVKRNFLIRAGSTVYLWKKGLVQGYTYSPALSEIYYQYLDDINFADHINNENDNVIKLFLRVVDDYFYITDSFTDALNFLDALKKYKNVNYEKTVVNFQYPDIKFSDEITFLGYSYRTVELQVSRASSVFSGQMCYKISFFSTVNNLYKFLESRIGQSSMQINGHIFNFLYNQESLVWEHIFTTFCLSANKFCTILALLCSTEDMATFLQLYKKKVTVKLGNTIIETLMKNKPSDFVFVYCINHFRYLSLLALSLCAKQTPKCAIIVPLINNELSKCNCIFGKWREHASRIDVNGSKLRMATKDICRRSDLRGVMRKFNCLPEGFQCFNLKLIHKT
ncbi:unnamed protein product [Diatraea saccharalis]|uniref:Telomerase reverse transcriptase n=1 Tax=Diatraea saccharalis TaxID=40085 RepID=A0A9N9RDV6_9NEOP|nr:unnamed protein product [Diatraea saccharalis]